MNTQNLHPRDTPIASNPVIVTFFKEISAEQLHLKKFIL